MSGPPILIELPTEAELRLSDALVRMLKVLLSVPSIDATDRSEIADALAGPHGLRLMVARRPKLLELSVHLDDTKLLFLRDRAVTAVRH